MQNQQKFSPPPSVPPEKKSSPSAAVSQATDAGMAATQSLTLNESVAVVHFESPHCIFIQKVDDVLGLANASEQLQKNQLTVLGTPKKGDIVFCDYLGELYRARIVEVKGSLAKIFYIDYGNWEERQTSCLLSLPEELKDMPGIAIKCSLDVSPADGSVVWPESLCAELRTVLVDSELFLATPLRRYLDTYIVTLVRNSDQLDVTRHLIEKGLARASVDELSLMSPGPAGDAPKRFMAADLGNVAEELRVGERKEIFCADISNRLDLSMQIPEKMDTMQSFNASLHKAYSTLPPPATPYLPVLGELVAARYSNDVLWYRAEVKAVVDEQVAVHFIDFGNMEVRPITDIRALQEEYARLPAQSFRCAVVGLNFSADKDWTAEQLMQFMTCVKLYMQEDSMKCIAEIKSKEPGVVWVDIVHEEREQTLAEVLPSVLEASLLPQPIQPVAAPLTPPVSDRASMFASQPCASAAATAVDVPTGMTSDAAATNFSGESSTLSSAILPLDTWLSCGIQEIYSCSRFYVNNMNEVTELDALREGLNELCFTPAGENACKAVKPGDIILAQFSADEEWYRGCVESLSDNGVTCHVLFVDYGNAEEKPVASLRVVPTRFLQLPAQGICCSLSGATASHSSDMDDLFRKFCWQAIVKVKAIRCTEGVYEVVVHTSDGKSVTELFNQTMGLTGQSATPTGQSVSPASQSGSPVDLAVPSAEQPVIPATRPVTVEGRPVTVEGRPVTPADPPMTPAGWPATPADQLVTPASRSVTPTSRPVTPADQLVTPEGQPVTPEDQPSRGSDTAASLDGPVMLDQLQIISPNSEEQEVIISHAVSPSIFYCQPVTIAADLVGLTAKLMACESAEPVSAVPHVGEVLCSKFDGGWYRSVVMDMADTTVSVHFIDYGNDAQVEMSELRPIPHDLSMEYCVGCFRCSLHGIHAPKGGWSDNALDYLKLLLNIPLMLKAVGESQGSHSVTINFNGINLAQDLVNSELAVELPDSTAGERIPPESSESIKTTVVEDVRQDRIMLATLQTVVLDTLEQEVVLVHSVSPSEFYCQLKTVAIAQQELDAQLTALCSVAKPVRGGPQVGEVLCAMFDGGWYRCVVNEVLGDQVSVHFIDYGNDALIKVSELWPAPRDLCMKYPVGCFKCSLHGIRMPEGGWSEEAITKQNRLVHSLIMLKAEGQSQGTWSVTIRTDGQDVAQDHVNSGLAVHAKPEPKQEPQLQTVQRQKTREELEREIEELQRLLQAKM